MSIAAWERGLCVRVRYGLSNRLLTMAKAFAWSRMFRRRYAIIWNPEEACGCRWLDLFQTAVPCCTDFNPSGDEFICYDGLYRDYGSPASLTRAKQTHRIRAVDLLDHRNLFINTFDLALDLDGTGWWMKQVLAGRLYAHLYRYLQRRFLLKLAMQPELKDRLPPWDLSRFTGLHIRVGDETQPGVDFPDFAKKFSAGGYERFYHLLDKTFKNDHKGKIFLACNSTAWQDNLVARYGDRVMFYAKRSLDRSSTVAIQDALIDLMLLSRTKRIIGTRYSSFSMLACLWGKIPIQLI